MVSQVIVRFFIVWGILNLILLPIEWSRWKIAKKAHWSWRGYIDHYMWDITEFILLVDAILLVLSIVCPILYWILEPVL